MVRGCQQRRTGMEGQTAKTVEYSDGGAVNKTMNKT